jgi:ATP-dependent helicase/nuclease subunit A
MARILVPALRGGGPKRQEACRRAGPPADRADVALLPALESSSSMATAREKASPSPRRRPSHQRPCARAADGAGGDRRAGIARRPVEAARPLRLRSPRGERCAALLGTSPAHWLPAFDEAKAARGWLDFDDLILRARALLSDPAVAQWVLFKLDGGIDHILVDEAQDTSPEQWQVIERCWRRNSPRAGRARCAARTIFVVGDRKQSIYSFQGADLRGFDAHAGTISPRASRIGSACTCANCCIPSARRGDPAAGRYLLSRRSGAGAWAAGRALAFDRAAPGRVDLWPLVRLPGTPETGDWDEPLDRPSEEHHEIVLARQIAAEIAAIIARGERIMTKDGPRAVGPGDFLILVRRRKLMFHEIIRACKLQGPARRRRRPAGAHRGTGGAGPDRAPALPGAARGRPVARLRAALAALRLVRGPALPAGPRARPEIPVGTAARRSGAAETLAVLSDLRDQTDFLRPYELIERVLTRHDGRRRMLARFGVEAEDAIEAFVAQALAYEAEEIPTLDGFLGWLEAAEVEVKRQSESAGGRIRVMTVHGAKGLEAPVVILPDTADRRDPNPPAICDCEGLPILRVPTADAPEIQRTAEALAAERQRDEADRLLYVALTRAERWLIVAGAGKAEKPDGWYCRVRAGMQALGAAAQDFPSGTRPALLHRQLARTATVADRRRAGPAHRGS